jgi:hypothetical protein
MRAAGRVPRDTRYAGSPADIESPPRMIEVKAFGTSNRGYELWLEARQVQEARTNPDFYVYVVENVRQGDSSMFTLRVLGGEHLARLVARAKEQQYFTIPWPVALETWLTGTPASGHASTVGTGLSRRPAVSGQLESTRFRSSHTSSCGVSAR